MRSTLRITEQTVRLLRECRVAERLLRRERGKSERVSIDDVLGEVLLAHRHHLAERVRASGCNWQMVLDMAAAEYSRRTGGGSERRTPTPGAESSGIVEE